MGGIKTTGSRKRAWSQRHTYCTPQFASRSVVFFCSVAGLQQRPKVASMYKAGQLEFHFKTSSITAET